MTNNRLCPVCKGKGLIGPYDPDEYELTDDPIDLALDLEEVCPKCNGTGLKKRI
jgi:RecJ-like exonuclease